MPKYAVQPRMYCPGLCSRYSIDTPQPLARFGQCSFLDFTLRLTPNANIFFICSGSGCARSTTAQCPNWTTGFRAIAQEILSRVARAPDEARAVADASSATLRFPSTHALSFTFLPEWRRSFEAHTSVGLIPIVSDVLQHWEALMLQGRVQFLLCHWHASAWEAGAGELPVHLA